MSIPKLNLPSGNSGARTHRVYNAPTQQTQSTPTQKPKPKQYNPENMPLTARDTRKPLNAPLQTDRTPQVRSSKGKMSEQQVKQQQMKETYIKYKTSMCRHWE